MINTIKFIVCIVDDQNRPCGNLLINCKALNNDSKTKSLQFSYKKVDKQGKVEFEFYSPKDSIDVEIEVHGNNYHHTFKNGDIATFRLFSDDLNMYLEMVTLENIPHEIIMD